MITTGPVQENCFLVRSGPEADRVLLVDPGDEAPRILAAVEELGATVEAILVTHAHFDHVGAVVPVKQATGAPVYGPRIELEIMRDLPRWTPPGFGPFEGFEPDHLLDGGETLELAGLTFDVRFTPGHSPGHVSFWCKDQSAIFSGDVLFQQSIGRTDLPGGDHAVLMATLAELASVLPDDTTVLPGHMGPTTIGQERQTNPFLLQAVSG